MFTVSGIVASDPEQRRRFITWENGAVAGDAMATAHACAAAEQLEGETVGPHEGPVTTTQHLAAPLSASIIMARVFLPETVKLAGDVPQRPPIPKGAIG